MSKNLKWIWRSIIIAVFLFSISLNIASFVGGVLWKTASFVWEGATGTKSVLTSQNDKIDALNARQVEANQRIEAEVASNKRLRGELSKSQSDLVTAKDNLVANKRVIKELREEGAAPTMEMVTFKGRRVLVSEAVGETTDRISRRATKTASREIVSMPAEAIPFWGTAVIVGVTAMEIDDLCNTLKDMNALKRAFDPSAKPDPGEITVCSVQLPSREELWQATKTAPGAAWATARESLPTLEDIRDWDLPQINAAQIWDKTKGGAAKMTDWLSDSSANAGAATLDAVTDIGGNAVSATSSGIKSLTSKTRDFFSESE